MDSQSYINAIPDRATQRALTEILGPILGVDVGHYPLYLDNPFTTGLTIAADGTTAINVTSAFTGTTGFLFAGTATNTISITGAFTTGINIAADGTTAIAVTSAFSGVTGISLAGTGSTAGINISGNHTTAITIGAQTTAGVAITGATATGISVTGSCTTAALQMGVSGTTAGDFVWYGTTALYKVLFDANGDTNGAVYIGADTKGLMFNLYGDTTGCGVFWDPSGDTNGTLSIGATGGSKGVDVLMYGATNGNYCQWDQSANSLLLVGTSTVLDVAGTTASTSPTTGAAKIAGGLGVAGKTFLGETAVVTDAKAVVQGMNNFPLLTLTSLTSAAAVTLTAAQVIGGLISDAVSEANAATLPAPADIVAAIPNCKVGTSFMLVYKNASSGAFTITVTANGSSTIVGTATIAQNNTKIFMAKVTNITGLSEAVEFYSVGTLVH